MRIMMIRSKRNISIDRIHILQCDRVVLFTTLALVLLGLVMVFSASVDISYRRYHNTFHYFNRQLIYCAAAFFLALVTIRIPMSWWQKMSMPLLLLGVFLLLIVLVPFIGHEVNGSRRWLNFGFFNVQPSEMVKIVLILYLSAYLAKHLNEVREKLSGFLRPLIIVMFLMALLVVEPDYGSAAVIFATAMGVIFLAGARLSALITFFVVCFATVTSIGLMQPYLLSRLNCFVSPWADPFNCGYQLTQSMIAFGRGHWFGLGLGNSVQKLAYLPEAVTDFIYAILAEELGVFGSITVIALFGVLIMRAMLIGKAAEQIRQYYHAYVAYGIALLLAFQVFFNIGVNTGLLPTKGLTLPLLSYGGSSLIASIFAIALLIRIDYEVKNLLNKSHHFSTKRVRNYG